MSGTNPPDPGYPTQDVGRPAEESTLGPNNDPVFEVVPFDELPPDVQADILARQAEADSNPADPDSPSPSPSGEGGDR